MFLSGTCGNHISYTQNSVHINQIFTRIPAAIQYGHIQNKDISKSIKLKSAPVCDKKMNIEYW